MTMTITTTWVIDGLDDLTDVTKALSDFPVVHNGLIITGTIVDQDPDDAPPHGIPRPLHIPEGMSMYEAQDAIDQAQAAIDERRADAVHERIDIVPEREAYIASLVMWTRENIFTGPIADVSNAAMHDVYRRFIMWGVDATSVVANVTPEQLSCLRGAYRDATGGCAS